MRPSQTLIPRLAALVRGSHTPQTFSPAETIIKLGESSKANRTRGWWTVSGDEGVSEMVNNGTRNDSQSTPVSSAMYRNPRSLPSVFTSTPKLTPPTSVPSTTQTTPAPPADKVPPPTLAWCDFLSMV